VSEVTFSEGGGGTSSVVGQFVSSTGKIYRRRAIPGVSRESREATIENGSSFLSFHFAFHFSRSLLFDSGRKKIQQISEQLKPKLSAHHIEASTRYFHLALVNNFTKGRRTNNVCVACIYVVCRREKTPRNRPFFFFSSIFFFFFPFF
jgi:transcription factor IIIB subunit 2